MAVEYNRQYIGARYVPTFFNNPNGSWEWAQGFQYEPLTIVKYGDNSFTSKQLVPASIGTPNMNPEYWANTGNYNGFLNTLQSQLDNVNASINDIEDKLGILINITSKDTLVITDSYGTQATSGENNFLNLVLQENKNVMGKAVGGTGFASKVYIETDFLDTLKSFNVPDKNKITKIIVVGGANDGNLINDGRLSESTLTDYITSFLNYALETYPNARVFIGFIGGYKGTQRNISYRKTMNVYHSTADSAQNAVSIFGDFIIMQNMSFFTDLIHPNEIASRILANMVNKVIKDSVFYYTNFLHPILTPELNNLTIGNRYCDTIFTPSNCTLYIQGKQQTWLNLVFSENTEFRANNWVNLFTLDNIPYTTELISWNCEIRIGVGSEVIKKEVTLGYYNNSIMLYVIEEFTAKVILLPPFQIVVNYMI